MPAFRPLLACLAFGLLALGLAAPAGARVTAGDLQGLLAAAGAQGVVVLRGPDGREVASDPVLADTGYVPASTFKILHGLIALETGAVSGPDAVIPWDGVTRDVASWNQDQTLRTAIARSAVWAFQVIARRIGPARMQEWVDRAGFGNRNLGGAADSFWLDGELRITPREQVDFVQRLAQRKLPFFQRSMDAVQDSLVLDRGEGWTLYGKTGWSGRTGWLVGWVERPEGNWFFATRIEVRNPADLAARLGVSLAALRRCGALP